MLFYIFTNNEDCPHCKRLVETMESLGLKFQYGKSANDLSWKEGILPSIQERAKVANSFKPIKTVPQVLVDTYSDVVHEFEFIPWINLTYIGGADDTYAYLLEHDLM